MFEVKNVSIFLNNNRTLINNLSFSLNKGDKLAIIGEEGNGKTTLLEALLGISKHATLSGSISYYNHSIGYLRQHIEKNDLHKTSFEYLFLNEDSYYENISKFYTYLNILHMKDFFLEQTMDTLSGGEKVKVSILKLLLEEKDILFLDEPTNDLDIETLEWLEKFIISCDKPILYVSHDEELLAKTANKILHLEQIRHKTECRHTLVTGDYDTYIKIRNDSLERQTQMARNEKREFKKKQDRLQEVMQKVEWDQNHISRKDPHGAKVLKKKMHSLKSQEKRLNDTELVQIPDVEENIFFFFENIFLPKTKKILDFSLDQLIVENKLLVQNIHLEVIGNEHICIVGKNGIGKTSLLLKIRKELEARKDIKIGYMPQYYDEVLKNYETVLDFFNFHGIDQTKARMYLGNMKFTKEEMTGKISALSNGSKAKLLFIYLVLAEVNVLLLDEPTRNVSPLSKPIIRESLKKFSGTIISISHDRKYINEVCDVVYELTPYGLRKKIK